MEINAEEKSILKKFYGYNFNKIEEIADLTAYEKKFFDKNNFVSPNFSVQTLYKVSGEISPLNFNRAVHSLMVEEKNFRSNYCSLENRTVKVTFDEYKSIPQVLYRNFKQYNSAEVDEALTKIMEADRRLTFDLQKGNLMRFLVFHTAEKEFAVLITLPQLIADSFDAKNFFSAVFDKKGYKKDSESNSNFAVAHVENSVKNYWEKFLQDFPPIKSLPYSKKTLMQYQEKAYREKISADLFSDLRIKAQSNKLMLMTILQTAWGFLLQAVNKVDDVAFCKLTANTNALNVIPIRLQSSKDETIESVIKKQFKQMVVSQPYSFFDWDNLQSITENKLKFDHFLSFLDFQDNQKTYSQAEANAEGTIVEKNSWDTCGMKLGVYFQYADKNLSVTFLYDEKQFVSDVGVRFAKIYNLILRQMLLYWDTPFYKFIESLKDKILATLQDDEENQQIEDRKTIVEFISTHKLLQGETVGTHSIFSESAKIAKYFEGDRISGEILDNNLVFVVEGKLARSLDTGEGWYNALDIISKGGWLNETVFLQKRRSNIAAEVLTEQATILLIPLSNVDDILRKNPQIYKSFMSHILSQMEKYQLLWLQS